MQLRAGPTITHHSGRGKVGQDLAHFNTCTSSWRIRTRKLHGAFIRLCVGTGSRAQAFMLPLRPMGEGALLVTGCAPGGAEAEAGRGRDRRPRACENGRFQQLERESDVWSVCAAGKQSSAVVSITYDRGVVGAGQYQVILTRLARGGPVA